MAAQGDANFLKSRGEAQAMVGGGTEAPEEVREIIDSLGGRWKKRLDLSRDSGLG